jgi:hypothetical protein
VELLGPPKVPKSYNLYWCGVVELACAGPCAHDPDTKHMHKIEAKSVPSNTNLFIVNLLFASATPPRALHDFPNYLLPDEHASLTTSWVSHPSGTCNEARLMTA